mmetsp:Transcript_13061/g.25621  ORF Transcript_13061/g.25621 Transcript_13061/m.25621 type:complete len:130 (+) Transcript_13061:937-1326(+)
MDPCTHSLSHFTSLMGFACLLPARNGRERGAEGATVISKGRRCEFLSDRSIGVFVFLPFILFSSPPLPPFFPPPCFFVHACNRALCRSTMTNAWFVVNGSQCFNWVNSSTTVSVLFPSSVLASVGLSVE